MAQPLVVDQLIEKAQAATGLERFDSESFREGLEILVKDLNDLGVVEQLVPRNENEIVNALANRLKITDYLAKNPELLQRPVERPVFVFGVPRTGTTLLSNLLAADPNRRSPLTWEIDDPVPPATTATLYSDPRAIARLEQEKAMLAANPDMGKYYRNSAIYPNECIFFMHSDFKTLNWESKGKLPNYKDYIFSTDTTSTYEYHKKFLQVLQSQAPGTFNLKMPSHALWLDTLLKIYPDARLVWTHRDPLTAVGSFCSLITLGHRGGSGRIDKDWIAEDMPWQAVLHADRIMDFRDRAGEDRVIDVHYADLMRSPIEQMRKLYAALGDEFTPEAQAGMQGWLDDNPQGKFGRHEYKLAEFGLTPDQVRGKFERYLSRYEVEAEG
ncbi:sulfotransferase [Phenylobacterium sp. LjRoot219]|uniref:sulfotransferase family protein n=1 Tax=Phenylobacterium sp. LjRoot219 TaxID=3342283 RepID=UPI003ECE7102